MTSDELDDGEADDDPIVDPPAPDHAWIQPADLPPAEVTRELFLRWRAARRGAAHPERMTNPVWTWLVGAPEVTAYQVRRHFGVDVQPTDAGWTHQRYGQSRTALPDGRVIAIGGEHEDGYDPDFFIYNDVIVTGADGTVEILGYPPAAFPPTDFHSATLVGDRIIVIGNLGYTRGRGPVTQVYALELATMTFAPIAATGDHPGWLSRHDAALSADGARVTVRGGQQEIRVGQRTLLRENPDAYTLDLTTRVWTRDTALPWSSWDFAPAPGHHSQLYLIGWLADHAARDTDYDRERAAEHRAQLGRDPDLAAHAARYQPPCPHTPLPRVDDEYGTRRIVVDGVVVRYVERIGTVRLTIEGVLPEALVATIVDDLRAKLATVEAMPYVATRLDG